MTSRWVSIIGKGRYEVSRRQYYSVIPAKFRLLGFPTQWCTGRFATLRSPLARTVSRTASANGHILDIGCGSGEPIAGYFIRQGFNVTGIDGASAQIARCRERFPQQRWLVNDMRTLDLGARFDGIIAWDSFFHLSQADQRKMFAVFLAHAADRAALMFTSGPDQGEAIGEFCGKPLFHASLSPTEYINLLHQHQFNVLEHRVEDPECGFHTVWLAVRGA